MAVVADTDAVAFIAERGGRLYVYADASGLKHVKTEAPSDLSIRFEQVEAYGFQMYVDEDIKRSETWTVKLHHLPYHHVDVLWDGQQPGLAFGSMYEGG